MELNTIFDPRLLPRGDGFGLFYDFRTNVLDELRYQPIGPFGEPGSALSLAAIATSSVESPSFAVAAAEDGYGVVYHDDVANPIGNDLRFRFIKFTGQVETDRLLTRGMAALAGREPVLAWNKDAAEFGRLYIKSDTSELTLARFKRDLSPCSGADNVCSDTPLGSDDTELAPAGRLSTSTRTTSRHGGSTQTSAETRKKALCPRG